MSEPEVTIVIVPRDHFSHAEASLESLFAHTSVPTKWIYIDCCSPPELRAHLDRSCRERDIELIRRDYPLTPNEARNLAIPELDTPYVVFVDNDVLVTEGWLEPLLETAKRHDAWLVGPLYQIGAFEKGVIHMAGGTVQFHENEGQRRFEELHYFMDEPLDAVRDQLEPGPTDLVEFHCMLVKTEVFERIGPLDEGLLTQAEHLDLCIGVKRAGGSIYFEPESLITYLPPIPPQPSDRAFYLLRWSDAWNRTSIDYFSAKWGIAEDDPYRVHLLRFLTGMRRRALGSLLWPLGRIAELLVHRKGWRLLGEPLARTVEALAIGRLEAQRPTSG